MLKCTVSAAILAGVTVCLVQVVLLTRCMKEFEALFVISVYQSGVLRAGPFVSILAHRGGLPCESVSSGDSS
jgi:hypothetical protein